MAVIISNYSSSIKQLPCDLFINARLKIAGIIGYMSIIKGTTISLW